MEAAVAETVAGRDRWRFSDNTVPLHRNDLTGGFPDNPFATSDGHRLRPLIVNADVILYLIHI